MKIFPAIDIQNGRCVRLEQGDLERSTVYHEDPAYPARQWAQQGATDLHVVDLDGAVQGSPVHAPTIAKIVGSTGLRVQVGGGIRNLDTAQAYLDAGADHIVLGTLVVENPHLADRIAHLHPGKVAAGLDVRFGRLATQGWLKTTEIKILDRVRQLSGEGFSRIIATNIDRDGLLTGPDLDLYNQLAEVSGSLEIVASGGIASLEDLLALGRNGCHGAILGRALYVGRITLSEALDAAGSL